MKSNMIKITMRLIPTVFFLVSSAVVSLAQEETTDNPLDPFEPFIGGTWHMEGSYQVLEWGIGKQSVKAFSYAEIGGEKKLFSEGSWFWHPGEKKIRGYFTAIHMPVVLFDYATHFENQKMLSTLKAYGPNGDEQVYGEVWDLKNNDSYHWSLTRQTSEGTVTVMDAVYTRKTD